MKAVEGEAGREPFGLLNVLKPCGMSSHDVVAVVRRVVGTRRVGHGGTLDPAAAGVMAVAVGKATRLLGHLRDDKDYRAEVVFGLATDSGDAEGAPIANADASDLTRAALEEALGPFRGVIRQRPPMTSAVHFQGKRLYELARAGVELPVESIPERTVAIHGLDLIDFVPGRRAVALLDVTCGAGTYIRSLAMDLGATVGLPACLAFLLRTRAGDCHVAGAQTLEELAEAPHFLPQELWLGHLKDVPLEEEGVRDVGFGRKVSGTEADAGTVGCLRDASGELVALAHCETDGWQPFVVF